MWDVFILSVFSCEEVIAELLILMSDHRYILGIYSSILQFRGTVLEINQMAMQMTSCEGREQIVTIKSGGIWILTNRTSKREMVNSASFLELKY